MAAVTRGLRRWFAMGRARGMTIRSTVGEGFLFFLFFLFCSRGQLVCTSSGAEASRKRSVKGLRVGMFGRRLCAGRAPGSAGAFGLGHQA